MTTNQSLEALPVDLIIEILLLLPFESLLNWKLVAKKWKNLINHSTFSNRYRNKSIAIFLDGKSLFCLLKRHLNPSTVHRLPIELPTRKGGANRIDHSLLSGSSNGVVCVRADNGHFLYYNLFSGESNIVENAVMRQRWDISWLRYGSGYDRLGDDYKIMLVLKEQPSFFWVYSFKSGEWKSFDGFPYDSYNWLGLSSARNEGFSLNGVLHWLCTTRGEGEVERRVIVTFELHTRKFGEIPVPDAGLYGTLTELDGRLCCVYRMSGEWVMEMYGGGGFWTKLLSFDPLGLNMKSICFQLNLIAYTAMDEDGDGGKVVSFLRHGKGIPRMVLYDIEKEKLEVVTTKY